MLLKPGKKYEMKHTGGELQLKIHDLNSSDSGTYKCCAGYLVTTASIIVKGMFLKSGAIHFSIGFMNSIIGREI